VGGAHAAGAAVFSGWLGQVLAGVGAERSEHVPVGVLHGAAGAAENVAPDLRGLLVCDGLRGERSEFALDHLVYLRKVLFVCLVVVVVARGVRRDR
jgi:hypothetical protein